MRVNFVGGYVERKNMAAAVVVATSHHLSNFSKDVKYRTIYCSHPHTEHACIRMWGSGKVLSDNFNIRNGVAFEFHVSLLIIMS